MADTYTLISSVTVGAGGASSIDFTSIPATYTDLLVKISARGDSTSNIGAIALYASINGLTTNRTWRRIYALGSSAGSDNGTNTTISAVNTNAGTSTASTFTNGEMYIPNYAGSTNKSFSVDFATENNSATLNELDLLAGLWSSTAAINQITLTCSAGNFMQYSTAYLYGIKNS